MAKATVKAVEVQQEEPAPKKQLVPMQSRMKVELLVSEEKITSSGLVIPAQQQKEQYRLARIISIGPWAGYDRVLTATHAVLVPSPVRIEMEKHTEYAVGDIILVNYGQLIHYRDTDGVLHYFVKDDSGVVAKYQ